MGAGRRFVRSARAASARLATVLVLAACRDEPTRATAPFAVEASLSLSPGIPVGSLLVPSPTFVVRNADGQPLANIPVSVRVTAGNGTLRNAPLRTMTGPTPVGEWTLDTIAGVNEVTISAGSAAPVRIALSGIAGAPARITTSKVLDGPAGDILSGLTLRVLDRYGNAVRDAAVDIEVAEGGGDVSPATGRSDANGAVPGVAWRLGRFGGSQRLVVSTAGVHSDISASIRSEFTATVRFHGQPPSPEVQAAFAMAADRLRALIVGDVADVPVLNFDMSRCGAQGATVSETIDDVLIYAQVTPIDGVGKVLASAGPCVQRTQSRFTVIGVMRFDAEDLAELSANGRLAPVVLHEMMHVIGIGPLWSRLDLLMGSGTQDPRFAGTLAGAQCIAAGGLASCLDGRVPLENIGGSGTAEVHWRESVFDAEVMTGFVETTADMPLSAMTIASLEDLGYAVNLLAADPYRIEVPAAVAPRLSPLLAPPWETIMIPLFEVTPSGWVRPVPAK